MKDQLSKILNILLILLMAVSAVVGVVFYVGTSGLASEAEFAEQISVLGAKLDTFLNWAIILVFVTAIAAILFPVINMISDPKNSKKTLFMVIGLVLVVLVAYGFASDEILVFIGYKKFFYDDITMDPNLFSKYVDTGLWAMYLLAGLSLLAILYYEIARFFK